MATCKNCGRNVGCGCNLTNGLCAQCYVESLTPKKCLYTIQSSAKTAKLTQ